MTDPGIMGRDISPVVISTIKPWLWASAAVVILLVLIQADAQIGGWLLIVLVMGMVYAARERKLI